MLTVTPRGRLPQKTSGSDCSLWKYTLGLVPLEEGEHFERSHVLLDLLHISLGAQDFLRGVPSGIESVLSTNGTHGLGRIAFRIGTH